MKFTFQHPMCYTGCLLAIFCLFWESILEGVEGVKGVCVIGQEFSQLHDTIARLTDGYVYIQENEWEQIMAATLISNLFWFGNINSAKCKAEIALGNN